MPFRGKKSSWLLAGGILALAALAAYHNSFAGPFIFDDGPAITGNPTIRKLWPLWNTLSPPQGGLTVSGRPLVNLSFALNYAAGGTAVWGYHALNLAIHVLAGLTLFGVVRRTLLCPVLRARFGAAAPPLALAVALLWTLHPLQTESVTYVVQRAESLMGLFYLLTLYCFIRGAESPAPGRLVMGQFAFSGVGGALVAPRCEASSQPTNWSNYTTAGLWQVLAVAACLAGMASKEVMISAPLMVLLYDRTFVAGTFREAWRWRQRFYLGLAGTWLLLGFVMLRMGGPRSGSAGFGIGVAWWAYALTSVRAIVHYLFLSGWPHPLVLDYGTDLVKNAGKVAPYALILVPLAAATVIGLRRRPVIGFVGACFFAILAPSSSVVPVATQTMAEHRMYLPLAAVIVLVVPGIYALIGRRPAIAGFLVLAAGLGWLTARRNGDYRSDLAIWSDTVAKRPGNTHAHYNLGIALVQAGRLPEAIGHYEEALRLNPDDPKVHNNLGIALVQMGRVDEAIGHFEKAQRLMPDFAEAHFNLANALALSGRVAEAIGFYEKALRLKPDFAGAHCNLGIALAQSGRASEAIGHYEKALRLDPGSAKMQNNLGLALFQTGRVAEAVEHYQKALQLKPDFSEAHYNLGNALLSLGRVAEAIEHYQEALRLQPAYAEAHNNLGSALFQMGRVAEAAGHYEEALRLKPGYADARDNLARLQALHQTPSPSK